MTRKMWRLVPFLIFSLLSLFLWRGLSLDPQRLPLAQMGKKLPDFDLPLLENETQHFTSNMLKNHLSLLIVWASWCVTCQDEALFLDELARQGVALYGINYKDDPDAAKQWLTDWGNPYRAIGIDKKGKLALNLGVYGAPETYLIDAKGFIRYRYAGALTPEVWQHDFLPRIKKLEA